MERVVKETGEIVDNGAMEFYVNAQVDDGTDTAGLMKVFTEDGTYDERFPKTSGRKKLFKTTERGVNQMCETIERNRREAMAEGLAQGKAEGKAEGKIDAVKNMIKAGLTTFATVRDSGLYTEQELETIAAP